MPSVHQANCDEIDEILLINDQYDVNRMISKSVLGSLVQNDLKGEFLGRR